MSIRMLHFKRLHEKIDLLSSSFLATHSPPHLTVSVSDWLVVPGWPPVGWLPPPASGCHGLALRMVGAGIDLTPHSSHGQAPILNPVGIIISGVSVTVTAGF